jgi:putative transposase
MKDLNPKKDKSMSTYTQILYQIVFGTKMRLPTLQKHGREHLFAYMSAVLKNKNCHCYRVGGVEDHIHIVTHIHPTANLDRLIKDIKLSSTHMIKGDKLFPHFGGWQEGYGAFTYAIEAKENLIRYTMNQEEHHRKVTFREEYIALLKEHQVEFDEKYLF